LYAIPPAFGFFVRMDYTPRDVPVPEETGGFLASVPKLVQEEDLTTAAMSTGMQRPRHRHLYHSIDLRIRQMPLYCRQGHRSIAAKAEN
jgi:hypothetical protein